MAGGEAWHLQHIQHTTEFTASLPGCLAATAIRTCALLVGDWARCERRYRVGEQWYNLRPDALAEYRVGQHMRFWLEWDRGTMNVRDLAVKFTSYAHHVASREWAREHSMLPVLICVAPDIAQERRMQRVAQARLTSTPGLVVWTTTKVLLNEHGLLAPIWLQRRPQMQPRSTICNGSLRQSLFDVLP